MKNVFKNEKEIFVIFRIHDVKKIFFCLKILKKNGKSINQSIYHLRCPPAESPGRRCRARPGARCAVPPPRSPGCRPPACTAGCAAHGVRPPSAPASAGRRRPHPQDLSQFDLWRNFWYISAINCRFELPVARTSTPSTSKYCHTNTSNNSPVISMGMVDVVEWEMLSGSPMSALSSPPCSGDWNDEES